MSRIRKKIEKRAAKILIKSGIFSKDDYDNINGIFWSTDYWGESNEINPWDYLYDLAVESTVEYVEVDWEFGNFKEFNRKEYLSIIDVFKLFKKNYLK